MPQFVLLFHECPSGVPRGTHWDLMLQAGDVLRTWVLDELPTACRVPGADLTVEETQPHRMEYLTFEGPLSGDRGSVVRVDRGPYEPIEISDCCIHVRLFGEKLSGRVKLVRPDTTTPHWQLSFAAAAKGPD